MGQLARLGIVGLALLTATLVRGQNEPIAIAPIEGVKLTGALEIAAGKAVIAGSGTVTAGEHSADITMPRRGLLRLCSTTKVSLTAANGLNPGKTQPGMMIAFDHGALEASYDTLGESDQILTPDFRIAIAGPGIAAVKVRLGEKGDTCVENRGPKAPSVVVTSVFDGESYRVQADQRVMFQHGSLREVVDNEKESCGCPPETPPSPTGNEFPVAQSAGLAPLPKAPPNATDLGTVNAQVTANLSYDGNRGAATASVQTPPKVAPPPAKPAQPKRGFFGGIGHFFKKIFGGK